MALRSTGHRRTGLVAGLATAFGALLPAFGLAAEPIGNFDTYRYRPDINNDQHLCSHMEGVYQRDFHQPWDFRAIRGKNFIAQSL